MIKTKFDTLLEELGRLEIANRQLYNKMTSGTI